MRRLRYSRRKRDAALARQCYFAAEDLLVRKGEYALCLNYIGDPQGKFEMVRRSWEMEKGLYRQQAERGKNHPLPSGLSALTDRSREADKRFVGRTRQLIEILVGAGRKAGAGKIRDQAVMLIEDPQMQSAVSDAEKKLGK